MRLQKIGQVSLEYLVILGFALLLLVPIVSIFQASSIQSEDIANANLILLSGRSFISNAESVFYQGKNSRVKMEVFFPSNIQNVTVLNTPLAPKSELNFLADFDGLNSSFVFFSSVDLIFGNSSDPCSGGTSPDESFFSQGNKIFFIHSCGGNVSIYEFQE